MTYLGNTPTTQSFISGTDYFNGDGSTVAFTLSRTVVSVNDIEVVINNVEQQPNTAYTVSGTTITFTSAPSAGSSNIYVRYLSTTTQSITPSQNTVSYNTLNSDTQSKLGISYKNRFINGACVIDQRNAGAAITPTGGGAYTVDRWAIQYSQASKLTAQQNKGSVTPPAGFTNYIGIQTAATATVGATDYFFMYQAIEGYNTADLAWGTQNAKTITMSFWVYSNTTGTFGGALGNNAGDRTYPFTYTINSAATWEYKTITITGCTTGTWLTTNGWGIGVNFSVGTGTTYSGPAGAWANALYFSATGATSLMGSTSNYIYFTGLQFEVGTQATTFDYRDYGRELIMCLRYYLKWTSYDSNNYGKIPSSVALPGGSTTSCWAVIFPLVQMRSLPTLSYSGLALTDESSNYNWSPGTISNIYAGSAAYEIGGAVTGLTTYRAYVPTFNGTANTYLSLSAEL